MLSVCVPVHINHTDELVFLTELLTSISKQRSVSFEVQISDDSANDDARLICVEFKDQGMDINYQRFFGEAGLATNLNNAISCARGDIVKVMMQDDLLVSPMVLRKIEIALKYSRRTWLLSACTNLVHDTKIFQNVFSPKRSDYLLDGRNTISSPSVVSFKRNKFVPLDTDLRFLVDCEWYLRMTHHFGLPIFGRKVQIVNRLHNRQATHTLKHLVDHESETSKAKHSNHNMNRDECICCP